jgi:hypothetical protein
MLLSRKSGCKGTKKREKRKEKREKFPSVLLFFNIYHPLYTFIIMNYFVSLHLG